MKCRWVLLFIVLAVFIFNESICSAELATGASYYEKALQEIKAGNYKEALAQVQNALAQSPGELEFQYVLGVIYFNLGRLDESEGIFLVLAAQDEAGFRKVWFDLAHIAKKRGRGLEAIDFLEKARPVDPERADLEIGVTYLELKDYQKAVDTLGKVQSDRPEIRFQARVYEASALSKQKKWNEAIKVLESLLKTPLTAKENDQVESLISALRAGERNDKRWHISGLVGFMYDTNLLMNPVSSAGLQMPSNQADTAQVSSITGRYDLIRSDPWVFGAGYNHYNLTYFNHPTESVVAASPVFYGYWNNPPYWAGIQYVYSHFWAGGASKADVHSLYPTFQFDAGPSWRTQVMGWAAWRDFYDTTPDDQLYGAGIIQYYMMRNGLANLRAGVLWGVDYTAPADAGSFYNTQFTAGFQWPVWKDKWFLDVTGFYNLRDFRYDPLFYSDISRTDHEKDLYVSLRGVVSDNMQVMFMFLRAWNDSNITLIEHGGPYEPFTYGRSIFSCMLTFEY